MDAKWVMMDEFHLQNMEKLYKVKHMHYFVSPSNPFSFYTLLWISNELRWMLFFICKIVHHIIVNKFHWMIDIQLNKMINLLWSAF
jgi:hypothetical protein